MIGQTPKSGSETTFVSHAHWALHIHGIPPADANSAFCSRCLSDSTWFKIGLNLSGQCSSCGLWSSICVLHVAAHQNFPLQTEKWRSSTKQQTWLNPTSCWLTPWMKKLHLLNPLCPAFEWQRTGNTAQPADQRAPVPLSSLLVFNQSSKMCTREEG